MPNDPPNDPSRAAPSCSTADAARRLGVSVPTVQRWVDQGHLKAWKTAGGHRRIDAESLQRFIASRGAAPDAARISAHGVASVLVVDDNADDRDLIALLAEAAFPGATVSHAESGFDALLAIGGGMPDVVVTDILMPNMNGLEMLRHLAGAAVRPRVIVAVTALRPDKLAALGAWPDGVPVLGKPIDPRRLIETLKAAAGAAQR